MTAIATAPTVRPRTPSRATGSNNSSTAAGRNESRYPALPKWKMAQNANGGTAASRSSRTGVSHPDRGVGERSEPSRRRSRSTTAAIPPTSATGPSVTTVWAVS